MICTVLVGRTVWKTFLTRTRHLVQTACLIILDHIVKVRAEQTSSLDPSLGKIGQHEMSMTEKGALTSSTESSTSRSRLSTNRVVKLFDCTMANSPV